MADEKAVQDSEKTVEQSGGKQANPEFNSFGNELLSEVLKMQKNLLTAGKVVKPYELSEAIRTWLKQKGKKQLLSKLDTWIKDHGGKGLSFEYIAEYSLPMGKVFGDAWRDQLETGMTEINKKGMTLLLQDKLGAAMSRSEKKIWDKFSLKAGVPANYATFTSYENTLSLLISAYYEFLDQLDEERASELRDASRSLRIANSAVLSHFKDLGIYDGSYASKELILDASKTTQKTAGAMLQLPLEQTVNMTEQLVDIEVGDTVLEQVDLLAETIEESKGLMLDRKFGQGLTDRFPLDDFYATYPPAKKLLAKRNQETGFDLSDKKKFIELYLAWIGKQDKKLTELMTKLWKLADKGSLNSLQTADKQQLLDIYVDQHLDSLKKQGMGSFLSGYAQSKAEEKKLLQTYEAFWRDIYNLNKNTVDLPATLLPEGTQRQLVFKNKDIIFPETLEDLSTDLTRLVQLDFVIDTSKTTLPVEGMFAAEYEHAKDTADDSSQTYNFKKDIGYEFKKGNEKVEGVVLSTADPDGIEIFDQAEYDDHFIAKTLSKQPKPLLRIPAEELNQYKRQETKPQHKDALRLHKKNDPQDEKPDAFDQLNLLYMGLLNNKHTASANGLDDERHIQQALEHIHDQPDQAELQHNDFFQSTFVGDAEMPDYIRQQRDGPIPAWIDKGKIFYNADIFAQETGVQVTMVDGNVTFGKDKLKVSKWIATYPELWEKKIRPKLEQRKRHEVTHRILEYHGIKNDPDDTEYALTVRDITGSEVHLTQETLCKIADGSFQVLKSSTTTQKTSADMASALGGELAPSDEPETRDRVRVVLENGDVHVFDLQAIETEVGQRTDIKGFRFDDVRAMDAKALESYLEAPEKFDDLQTTFTRRGRPSQIDTMLTTNQRQREAAASAASTRELLDKMYVDSGQLLTMIKHVLNVPGLQASEKIEAIDAKAHQLDRNIQGKLEILRNEQGTPEQLAKHREFVTRNFEKLIELLRGYLSTVQSMLTNGRNLQQDDRDFLQDKLGETSGIIYQAFDNFEQLLKGLKNNTTASDETRDWANDMHRNVVQDFLEELKNILRENNINPVQRTEYEEKQTYLEEEVSQLTDPEQDNEVVENREAFLNRFNDLAGDLNAGFRDGTMVMRKLCDSSLPGKASVWIECELTNCDGDEPAQLIVRGATESKAIDKYLGQKIELPKTVNGLNQFVAKAKGQVYKFQGIRSVEELQRYVTDTNEGIQTRNSKIQSWLPNWGADILQNGFQKTYFEGNQKKTGKVAYIGKTFVNVSQTQKLHNYFYRISWTGGGVRVSSPQGGFTKLMSYTSFLTFCMDKGLSPFTEAEYNNLNQDNDMDVGHKLGSWRDNLISPAVFLQAIKKFPEAYKYKLQQQQKYEAARLYAGFASIIPDGATFLYGGDIKADAISDLDSNITQVIEGYKNRLARGDDGSEVHGSKVAKLIETEVFVHMGSTTRFKHKAAGYLLYATQKAGGAYFRALSKYADKGMWVRALLGEDHQKKYLLKRNALIDQLKSAGKSDDELMHEVAKSELAYIAKVSQGDQYDKLYGTRFGRWIEDEAHNLGQPQAAKNVQEGISKKGSIYEMYDGFRAGGIGNATTRTMLGALLAMENAVEDMGHYDLFYKSIIQLILSGYGTALGKGARDMVKGICRRTGIPIGLFLSDPLQAHKVVTIIDYIASTPGDGGTSFPKLSTHIQSKVSGRKPKELNAHNYAEGGRHKKVMGAIDSWWEEYGYMVMSAFNYKNTRLIGFDADGDSEDEKYINQYFDECVFDSYKARPDKSSAPGDGQSPFYQEGIFNVASGFFEDFMLRVDSDGSLRYGQARDMWEQFGAIVSQFDTLLSSTSNPAQKKFLIRFLLKKFKQYFGSRFSSKDFKYIEDAFIADRETDELHHEGDKSLVDRGYRDVIKGKMFGGIVFQERKRLKKSGGRGPKRITGIEEELASKRGSKGIEESVIESGVEGLIDIVAKHSPDLSQAEAREEVFRNVFSD